MNHMNEYRMDELIKQDKTSYLIYIHKGRIIIRTGIVKSLSTKNYIPYEDANVFIPYDKPNYQMTKLHLEPMKFKYGKLWCNDPNDIGKCIDMMINHYNKRKEALIKTDSILNCKNICDQGKKIKEGLDKMDKKENIKMDNQEAIHIIDNIKSDYFNKFGTPELEALDIAQDALQFIEKLKYEFGINDDSDLFEFIKEKASIDLDYDWKFLRNLENMHLNKISCIFGTTFIGLFRKYKNINEVKETYNNYINSDKNTKLSSPFSLGDQVTDRNTTGVIIDVQFDNSVYDRDKDYLKDHELVYICFRYDLLTPEGVLRSINLKGFSIIGHFDEISNVVNNSKFIKPF